MWLPKIKCKVGECNKPNKEKKASLFWGLEKPWKVLDLFIKMLIQIDLHHSMIIPEELKWILHFFKFVSHVDGVENECMLVSKLQLCTRDGVEQRGHPRGKYYCNSNNFKEGVLMLQVSNYCDFRLWRRFGCCMVLGPCESALPS
jgi:hypothetical protein